MSPDRSPSDAQPRHGRADEPTRGVPETAVDARPHVDDPHATRDSVRVGGVPPQPAVNAPPAAPAPDIAAAEVLDVAGEPRDRDPQSRLPRIDGYEILYKVARGGMGVVYCARQRQLDRIVALKVIRSGSLATEEQIKRFYTEAAAAARLDHPGIVPVYEVGESNGQHFYSMAFVDGESLAELLQRHVLGAREAAQGLLILAEAMAHAHQQGIVHRDLKPANILLAGTSTTGSGCHHAPADRGRPGHGGSSTGRTAGGGPIGLAWRPKITDFGLAKQTEADSELTSTGQVLGTPSYMPPEQAKGAADVGPAADIYALGAVLYAMLTGRPPFQAASTMETLRMVLDGDPVPPSRLVPTVDRDLETICLKCLEKKPAARYGSADDLADDLGRYLQGEPIHARPVSRLERAWRWCRRKPAAATALTSSVVLLAALVAIGLITAQWRYSRQLARTRAARLEAANKERALRESELRSARALAAERARLAETQRYFGLLGRVQMALADPSAGQIFAGLDQLSEAARLAPTDLAASARLRALSAALLIRPDVRPVTRIKMPLGYRSHRLRFHPTRPWLAIATLKNRFRLRVLLCDARTGKVLRDLAAPVSVRWQLKNTNMDGIRQMGFTSGGRQLAVLTRSGWIYVWDLDKPQTAAREFRFPRDGMDRSRFHPQRPELFYIADERLYRWSWPGGGKPVEFGEGMFPGEGPNHLVLDGTGRRLAVVGSGHVALFDSQTLRPLRSAIKQRAAGVVCFSPDGRRLANGDGQAGAVILDVDSGRVTQRIVSPTSGWLHGSKSEDACWSIDGNWVLTTGRDRWRAHGEAVRTIAVSADGRWVATGSNDRSVRIWRRAGRRHRLIVGLPREPSVITRVRFGGNSLFVLPAGASYVRVWHWKQLAEFWRANGLE